MRIAEEDGTLCPPLERNARHTSCPGSVGEVTAVCGRMDPLKVEILLWCDDLDVRWQLDSLPLSIQEGVASDVESAGAQRRDLAGGVWFGFGGEEREGAEAAHHSEDEGGSAVAVERSALGVGGVGHWMHASSTA